MNYSITLDGYPATKIKQKVVLSLPESLIKTATRGVLENTGNLNRYNRKQHAYRIIGEMYAQNEKRANIINRLAPLGINANYASILIQKWRKETGLAELRSECNTF